MTTSIKCSQYVAAICETKYNKNGNKYYIVKWGDDRKRVNAYQKDPGLEGIEIVLGELLKKHNLDANGFWVTTKISHRKDVFVFVRNPERTSK